MGTQIAQTPIHQKALNAFIGILLAIGVVVATDELTTDDSRQQGDRKILLQVHEEPCHGDHVRLWYSVGGRKTGPAYAKTNVDVTVSANKGDRVVLSVNVMTSPCGNISSRIAIVYQSTVVDLGYKVRNSAGTFVTEGIVP